MQNQEKGGTGPGFDCFKNKGFHITFQNGWTVSIQFGAGNYCSNYSLDNLFKELNGEITAPHSATAEIAAWDKNGNWYEFEGGEQVKGYVGPEEALYFMTQIATKP